MKFLNGLKLVLELVKFIVPSVVKLLKIKKKEKSS